MKKNIWLDGMMGLVVGDALGVPVQFMGRKEIRNRKEGPVTGMESGGVYNMPKGTWSDDSSMALATLSSILDKGEADPGDIMLQFVKWELKGEYTPFGEAFDEGNTCSNAIYDFVKFPDITKCGATGEHANGNGALMRILPACLYYYCREKMVSSSDKEAIREIHQISGLTHNHLRSKMCCGLYYFCVKSIIDGLLRYEERKAHWDNLPEGDYGHPPVKPSLVQLLQEGIDQAKNFYSKDIKNLTEMSYLGRLFDLKELKKISEDELCSSGYVIDSIEAAFWCLITTDSFQDCLLKAVNLGDDTDTIGAIAGGLAGLYYGYESIPSDWLSVLPKREWIENLCHRMDKGEAFFSIPVTDIHTHCLFDVDDGARTPEMAIAMLRDMYLQGARHIFCTSHDFAFEDNPKKAEDAFRELQCRCLAVMPDLRLYKGCEIYVEPILMPDIVKGLREGKYPTMNETKYILIEFPTFGLQFEQVKYCAEVVLAEGWIPILAHCERYPLILDGMESINILKDMGCLIQVNAYSLAEESNEERKAFALSLADQRLIDFIGSDAHNYNHRPPRIVSGVKEIYMRLDKEYADAICYKNAMEFLGTMVE